MRIGISLVPHRAPAFQRAPDPAQELVLAHQGGPLLVLGSAGTGKTTTLLELVVHRIVAGADPASILVLTSSRRSGNSLRDRVAWRLPTGYRPPEFMTVHALCLAIMKRFGPDLRLLTAPEQEARLREMLACAEVEWPDELAQAVPTRIFAQELREALVRARQLALEPEDLAADQLWAAVGRFFEHYLQVLDAQGLIDYAELVYRTRLLLARPEIRSLVSQQYQTVVVDEFEEFDASQIALLRAIAPDQLIAFADPDQAAFGFRGADARATWDFPQTFAGPAGLAPVTILDRQWRMPAAVATANQRLTARLPVKVSLGADRHRQYRQPSSAGFGRGVVDLWVCDSPGAEVDHIADLLRRAHLRDGIDYEEMAVIVRNGRANLTPLARALSAAEIPVEIATEEIALARQLAVRPLLIGLAALDGHLSSADARTLLLSALGGLDVAGLRRLERSTGFPAEGDPVLDLLTSPPADDAGEPERAAAISLGRLLAEGCELAVNGASVDALLWHLWASTSWPQRLQAAALRGGDPLRRADRDLDAVVALFDVARRFRLRTARGGISTFLAEVSAQQIPADSARVQELRKGAVRLLTAHRAKGLSWRLVVVAGVQEGTWPDLRRRGLILDPDRLGAGEISEPANDRGQLLAGERRLFHLACSRASDRLVVTAAAGTAGDGNAVSRFVGELGTPVRRFGRPKRPITMAALVAELRRNAADGELAPGLRASATVELARLHDAGVPAADPRGWWGLAELTMAEHPIVAPGKPVPVSPSALAGILTCARQWFLARKGGGVGPPRSAAAFGTVIHALVDQAARERCSAVALADVLDQTWDRLGYGAQWESAAMKANARDALERYDRWRQRHGQRAIVASEIEFDGVVDLPGEQVRLRGMIDRIECDDAGLHIIDFKTSGSLPREPAEIHAQLGVYQLAVAEGLLAEATGKQPRIADAQLVYLQIPASSRDQSAATRVQAGMVEQGWIREQLSEAAKIIRHENFAATVGPQCRYCAFITDCPGVRGGQQ